MINKKMTVGSKWDKWKHPPNRFVIKKRVASSVVRIEPKPEPEPDRPQYFKFRTKPSELCMASPQVAAFVAQFKVDGAVVVKKYCDKGCLDT